MNVLILYAKLGREFLDGYSLVASGSQRSKNPGFAGIDNELYFSDRTWMLFGDAKVVIGELVKELAGGSGMH